jgi:tetratricopeptide (TPR) repeat protein
MVHSVSRALLPPTIRVVAAGLGSAVAGPLGCVVGGFIGDALGIPASDLINKYLEKFGEEASKKLLETGGDSLSKKLKESTPDLAYLYREALRRSLGQIRPNAAPVFGDWFDRWEICLKGSTELGLEEVRLNQLAPEQFDDLLRHTLERLDAQGGAIHDASLSLHLVCRTMPPELFAEITTRLAGYFKENFQNLIITDAYKQAWNQAELIFRDWITIQIAQIEERTKVLPRVADDTSAIRRILEEMWNAARADGRISAQDVQAKDKEIARLTEELSKLQQELAARATEPAEKDLSGLLSAGKLEAALQLKSQQVEARRKEAGKLARDLYELGIMYELHFDWPDALATFREAWQIAKDPEFGFKYAVVAQRLNRFQEAIDAFEGVLSQSLSQEMRADALNDLAFLYRDTNRVEKAIEASLAALEIRRQLANIDEVKYRSHVGDTLNNLGLLYNAVQQDQAAEDAYRESLEIRRQLAQINRLAYLADVASTLNNLAVLHHKRRLPEPALEAYLEALADYREVCRFRPDLFTRYVAGTLNNLANFYRETQQFDESERAYRESLALYRQLAKGSPDEYLPTVALALDNLGILYVETQRLDEAERAHCEALVMRRTFAEMNPDARPAVAASLNNIAHLYLLANRIQEANEFASEAVRTLEPFWQGVPELYGNQMAKTLWMKGLIREAGGEFAEACTLANRAKSAGFEPALQQAIQEFMDRVCPKS